jgi:hypothetical protein
VSQKVIKYGYIQPGVDLNEAVAVLDGDTQVLFDSIEEAKGYVNDETATNGQWVKATFETLDELEGLNG